MGKKKHKKHAGRHPGWGEAGPGEGHGGYGGSYGNIGAMNGMGQDQGAAPGATNWNAAADMAGIDRGLLHGLQGMVGSRHTEQFILGALIGAAAVYVLGDEDMRNKLVRTGMKLYAGVAGGFEEIKEQMADIRAEVDAEQQGGK